MVLGVRDGVPQPLEVIAEAGVVGEVGADHEGVDEQPDGVLELPAVAVGHGRADQDVLAARVAAEDDLEGRQHGRVESAVGLPAEPVQPLQDVPGDRRLMEGRATGRQLPVRAAVRRESRGRQLAAQLIGPVGELALGGRTAQPFLLPFGEIGVLELGLLQFEFAALGRIQRAGAGRVVGEDLLEQQPRRPSVTDDVVHSQGEYGTLFPPQQRGPEERTGRQVEGPVVLGVHPALGVTVAVRLRHRPVEPRRGVDVLCQLPFVQHEPGAQRLVPVQQTLGAGPEHLGVHGAVERAEDRHVIRRPALLHLLEEIHPLLSPRSAENADRRLGECFGRDVSGQVDSLDRHAFPDVRH